MTLLPSFMAILKQAQHRGHLLQSFFNSERIQPCLLAIRRYVNLFRCLHVFMGMRFRNHVIQSNFWSQRGTKRDTATIVFIFKMFEQDSALPQSEGDHMTPHLLNLVHIAVRSRFEGAQTFGHTRIYVYMRKLYIYTGPKSYTRPALHNTDALHVLNSRT